MAKKRTITAEEAPRLLELLDGGTEEIKKQVLQQLCPCRSKCDHRDLWLAICRAYDSPDSDGRVRHQAFHALETLLELAETKEEAQEMRDWLTAQNALWLPLENPERTRKRPPQKEPKPGRKLTFRDVLEMLEALACSDTEMQKNTLQMLCPCRNRVYDRQVWIAIFEAYEQADTGEVRDQAFHAIDTLLQRARTDPRSQELLTWLTEQGINRLPIEDFIPVWQPHLRGNGLYIPRFEPSPRSRSNRRR